MIKDIEKTAKEIIEKNLPYPPIQVIGRETYDVEVEWDVCMDKLYEALNDSVGCPVDDTTDILHGQIAVKQIERLQVSPWFEKTWEDYVSDYCTDKRYETEMFNEAERLP